jgi:hypothetical protein
MIYRPILFSPRMILALLAGTKTQTRRVIRRQPHMAHLGYMMLDEIKPGYATLCGPDYPDGDADEERCPYGAPGDRLWVRETYRLTGGGDRWQVLYKADQEILARFHDKAYKSLGLDGLGRKGVPEDLWTKALFDGKHCTDWRPSIFMPRWASRLTLEVCQVRCEQLHQITVEDAAAEGFGHWSRGAYRDREGAKVNPLDEFRKLWEEINGRKHPWKSNPWVWAITFRQAAMQQARYKRPDGQILFVDTGIGRSWATYYRKPNGSLKRVVSKDLPPRATMDVAEADLQRWAESHGATKEPD